MAEFLDDVECIRETDDALLVTYEGEEIWFPRSQIIFSESDVVEKGDAGTLVVTDWIARQRGIGL